MLFCESNTLFRGIKHVVLRIKHIVPRDRAFSPQIKLFLPGMAPLPRRDQKFARRGSRADACHELGTSGYDIRRGTADPDGSRLDDSAGPRRMTHADERLRFDARRRLGEFQGRQGSRHGSRKRLAEGRNGAEAPDRLMQNEIAMYILIEVERDARTGRSRRADTRRENLGNI